MSIIEVPSVTDDKEWLAIQIVCTQLSGLADDDARRRVIAYAQSRCIKPSRTPEYYTGQLNQYAMAAQAQGGGTK